MVTDTLLSLHPGVSAQAKHVVVGKARAAKRASKDQLLLWRWVKPESVGALNVHSHGVYNMCNHHGAYGAALYLPGLKSGVSREFR